MTGCCEQGLEILVLLNVGTFVCIKSSFRLSGRTVLDGLSDPAEKQRW